MIVNVAIIFSFVHFFSLIMHVSLACRKSLLFTTAMITEFNPLIINVFELRKSLHSFKNACDELLINIDVIIIIIIV
jgi:hypothetical protein